MRLFTGRAIGVALAASLSIGCGRESGAADSSNATPNGAVAAPSTPSPQSQPAPAQEANAAQPTALDPDAAYDKAGALAADRRFAEARQTFEDAARQTPTHGALVAGVAIFDDLTANRVSEEVVQRLFRAGRHVNADRWAEAWGDIDEAIKLAPRYPRAHGLRGTFLLEQGKAADAVDAFDTAVRIDPEFAEGYYNRGAAQAALSRFDAAIADFTRAIELREDFWDAYTNRGLTLVKRGLERQSKPDMMAAMEDYDRAHGLNPRAIEPLYLRGGLYAIAEQWSDAESDFSAVIAIDAEHAGAYQNRGLARRNLGRHELAAADLEKAAALQK
jgi:tetratricopeptide (TPR) repeat protein